MENKSAELKVGLVVLITLVALAWGITWIKGWNISQNTYEVKVLFPNVGILNVGDPEKREIVTISLEDASTDKLADGTYPAMRP